MRTSIVKPIQARVKTASVVRGLHAIIAYIYSILSQCYVFSYNMFDVLENGEYEELIQGLMGMYHHFNSSQLDCLSELSSSAFI